MYLVKDKIYLPGISIQAVTKKMFLRLLFGSVELNGKLFLMKQQHVKT